MEEEGDVLETETDSEEDPDFVQDEDELMADREERGEEGRVEEQLYLLFLVGVGLRVPLLFFFDILSNGFLLCALLSYFGPSSTLFSGYSISLNDTPVAIRPKEIPFPDALFSWNCECALLWSFLSWTAYIPFLVIELFLFAGTASLFLAYNSNIIKFWAYFLPLACLYGILGYSVAGSSTFEHWMSNEGESPEGGINLLSNQTLGAFSSLLGVVTVPMQILKSGFNIGYHLTIGYAAKRVYFHSRSYIFPTVVEKLSPCVKYLMGLAMMCPAIQSVCSRFKSVDSKVFKIDIYLVATIFAPILAFELAFFILFVFRSVVKHLKEEFRDNRQIWNELGSAAVIQRHWERLHIPSILRCYWISRMSIFALYAFVHYEMWKLSGYRESVPGAARYLMARGCETWVAVAGMTSVVSVVGQWVGTVFGTFLRPLPSAEDDDTPLDEETSGGSLTGLLFLVLAAQTGLTELVPEKRLLKLYRNLWLLSMAMLHFVHHLTNAVLLRLSTTGYYSKYAHGRALLVAAFLLITPLSYVVVAGREWEAAYNPWTMSVVLFAIEVSLKVIITLIVYAILMYHLFQTMNDVDEVVYWVKGVGQGLELIFAVLLLLNAIWILLFEQTGVLRLVMIGIHAYCNVYLSAIEGYQSIRRRWQATQKLDQLRSPSKEWMRDRNSEEVCSICYQDWTVSLTVKQTNCGHYFHETCIKKWLYVQDTCPMCHASIMTPSVAASSS